MWSVGVIAALIADRKMTLRRAVESWVTGLQVPYSYFAAWCLA